MTNSAANVIKVVVFWACFWLLFIGLQQVQISGLGVAAAPIAAGIAIIAVMILIRVLLRTEGSSRHDIGLSLSSRNFLQFIFGVGLGVAVVAVLFAALLLLTPLQVEMKADSNFALVILASFAVLFALALMEELVFRSYPLFRLQEAWGIRAAVYITSVAFAFYHGFAFENLLGPGVWGLFYAWMAYSTKSIALPTGFHLGLNWLQALMGMKPRYSDSIWELSMGSGGGIAETETLGLVIQLLLLVAGVVLVEKLVREEHKAGHN